MQLSTFSTNTVRKQDKDDHLYTDSGDVLQVCLVQKASPLGQLHYFSSSGEKEATSGWQCYQQTGSEGGTAKHHQSVQKKPRPYLISSACREAVLA